MILSVLAAFGDLIIAPQSLPDNIKAFISQHFSAQIALAQRDRKSFEVNLTDGTELEFDLFGNLKEIESDFAPIPFAVLPANIAAIIQHEYPGAMLYELKRKMNYYKIKLSNHMELRIDLNGTILSREFDDWFENLRESLAKFLMIDLTNLREFLAKFMASF